MRATIKDVAKKARVSTATVSRVLNKSGFTSEEVKKRVLEAIDALEYVPNVSAQSLVKREDPLFSGGEYVGVLFGKYVYSNHSFFSNIISGIEETMFNNSINIVISSTSCKEDLSFLDFPPFIQEKSIKYIIVIGEISKKYLSYLKKNDFFVVIVDDIGPVGFDCVLCDYKRGSLEAIEYLFKKGHTKIGLICGPSNHYFSKTLLNSYIKAFGERGVELKDDYIVTTDDFSHKSGMKGAEKLFNLSCPPTAIFTNDEMAVGVFYKALEKGICIPDDLSVIGFDDIEIARFLNPPLTTMRIPSIEMGALAAKAIVEYMNRMTIVPPQRIEISPILVERGSCQIIN